MRALALGCLLGAGLLAGYAWLTRKRKPEPRLVTVPRYVLEGKLAPPLPQTLTEDEWNRWLIEPSLRPSPPAKPRPKGMWCDLCGCKLLPDGRCPDLDAVHYDWGKPT